MSDSVCDPAEHTRHLRGFRRSSTISVARTRVVVYSVGIMEEWFAGSRLIAAVALLDPVDGRPHWSLGHSGSSLTLVLGTSLR